jgi:hypothetical protein
MKETFYFSHDYNARTDEKIKKLIKKHGMMGYGIFWSIVEDLYNNANELQLDYEGIAYDLRTDTEIIKSIINDFDLFRIKDKLFGSISIQRRLEERNKKSESARQSAYKRWRNDANSLVSNTNVLKTNTINKGKDIKDIKDTKGYKNKKSRKSETEFFSGPDQESAGREEQEESRAGTPLTELLLEDKYLGQSELIKYNPELESEPQDIGWNHSLEAEPDRKVIFLSAEPEELPLAMELDPKKYAKLNTMPSEPKVEKVVALDWDEESERDRNAIIISAETNESLVTEEQDPDLAENAVEKEVEEDW